jgi:copper chaperone CopZ
MKTKIVSIVMLLGLSSLTLFAGPDKTEKFKVTGNCGMCEARIEKAATSLDGVSEATWDKETKMLEVSLYAEKTNRKKIHKAIADVGHDTKMVKAVDETYDKLPACCKYDRMSKQTASCCANSSKECSGDHVKHESSGHSY